jgi:hypothetical protein
VGLVASAFGMLHCRDDVAALVARWRAGPWAWRLDKPAHSILWCGDVSHQAGHVHEGSEMRFVADTAAARARARFARCDSSSDERRTLTRPDGVSHMLHELAA